MNKPNLSDTRAELETFLVNVVDEETRNYNDSRANQYKMWKLLQSSV